MYVSIQIYIYMQVLLCWFHRLPSIEVYDSFLDFYVVVWLTTIFFNALFKVTISVDFKYAAFPMLPDIRVFIENW